MLEGVERKKEIGIKRVEIQNSRLVGANVSLRKTRRC